jgi:hypothetical protein
MAGRYVVGWSGGGGAAHLDPAGDGVDSPVHGLQAVDMAVQTGKKFFSSC